MAFAQCTRSQVFDLTNRLRKTNIHCQRANERPRLRRNGSEEDIVKQPIAKFMTVILMVVSMTNPVLGVDPYPWFHQVGTCEVSIIIYEDEPVAPAPEPEPEKAGMSLVEARRIIAGQLVELGRSPGEAGELSMLLTQADLDVLIQNPAMMQVAGAMSAQTNNLIMGLLVLGGLIAIAAAGDGFILRN